MIRRITLDEVDAVADLYVHEYAPELGQHGKPPIVVWLQNCALHPRAFCLVDDDAGAVMGFAIASLAESPVTPGLAGQIDELWARDDDRWLALAREAIARLRHLGAGTVRFDVPRDGNHGPLLEGLGFEANAVRYVLYNAWSADETKRASR